MFRKILLSLLILSATPMVFAANCEVDLEGNDAMQFNLSNIDVPKSCSEFTINLKHVGKLQKNVMGHNVVIAKTSDIKGIDADGMKAGLENDYVKPDDQRVIAHSEVIGGGESTSVSFETAKLEGSGPYSFFCSFPGHSAIMKGTIKRVE
jgi:azurin